MSKASVLLSEMGMAWVSTRQLGRGMAFLLAFVPAATVSLPAVAFATEDAPLTDLAALRWQHRIILIAPEVPDAIKRLRAAASAIDERDIIWFVAHRDQLLSNYPGQIGVTLVQHLDERYFGPSGAKVLLIGKDGELKSGDQALDLSALFARIDAMPMRRREMEAAE
jgi:hypothetical protein